MKRNPQHQPDASWTSTDAKVPSAQLARLANDRLTLDLLANGRKEAEMTVTLRLPVDEWITLLKGAAKNNISVEDAIAFVISTGNDTCDRETDGFSMGDCRPAATGN